MKQKDIILKEKKHRKTINLAKERFIYEHKNKLGILIFYTDFNMNEYSLLSWYKTQLKLDKILKKYKL